MQVDPVSLTATVDVDYLDREVGFSPDSEFMGYSYSQETGVVRGFHNQTLDRYDTTFSVLTQKTLVDQVLFMTAVRNDPCWSNQAHVFRRVVVYFKPDLVTGVCQFTNRAGYVRCLRDIERGLGCKNRWCHLHDFAGEHESFLGSPLTQVHAIKTQYVNLAQPDLIRIIPDLRTRASALDVSC